MARGQRKPIEEKIREKEELIAGLKERLHAEEKELAELKKEKRSREIETITLMLEEADISIDEAREIIAQHVSGIAV
mgnify:FL=1